MRLGFLGFFKSRTEPDRNRSVWLGFGSVSVCFFKKKKPIWLFFVVKNRTEPKMITPSHACFGASGLEVSSRHQKQNCKGGKAQNRQYMAGWAWLLQINTLKTVFSCL
jgi:hypothetical protein